MVYWALVVEDNEALRSVMAEMFEVVGLKVLTARDGAEAVHILNDFMPDLITLDYNIPGMSGLSLLQHIRQSKGGNRVTVVLVTGDYRVKSAPEAALADLFLEKPVSMKDLVALTDRISHSVPDTEPSGSEVRQNLKKANPSLFDTFR